MTKTLPSHVQVVIIGGGIAGLSTAYHLSLKGWSVALLERKQLTSGTTWHAAGLVSETQATPSLSKLAQYGLDLMERLEAETGQVTGFQRVGSMTLALSDDRMEELRRKVSYAYGCGLQASEITLSETQEKWPHLSMEGAKGAVWFPGDGYVNPIDVSQALAKGAKNHGARIFENCHVERILFEAGRAVGVESEYGEIRAEFVVNATGMWGRDFALTHDVALPLHTCNHYYVVTEPIANLPKDLPVLRVMDEYAYYKQDAGKLLIGCSEPNAHAWVPKGGIPEHFEFDELPMEESHLYDVLEAAMDRVPILAETGIRTFFNGPESFTPDGFYYLGPILDKPGLFVIAGFNSTGIQNAPGAGKALAEWIMKGASPMDLVDVDVRRVHPKLNAPLYVQEKAAETLSMAYGMHWPNFQRTRMRGLRRTPYYHHLKERGAVFAVANGWERPLYFNADQTPHEYGFGALPWHAKWKEEHQALREDLGLIDLTFGRFLIQGDRALEGLNWLLGNNVDEPVGSLIYTPMLNDQGGIEGDVTIARLSENRFMLMASAGAEAQTESWLAAHLKASDLSWTNITAGEACLALMGPRARDFLQDLTDTDLSNDAFPFGTFQTLYIGPVQLRAQRITFVGELGWELHVASDMAPMLFEYLMGAPDAPKLCGGMAVDSCRIEKGFRHWGHDIGGFDRPLEAGLGFTLAWDKPGGFKGKDALLPLRSQALSHRMVQVHIEDDDCYIFGKESILKDGKVIGKLTSASRSHSLGGAIGMGYIAWGEGASLPDLQASGIEIGVSNKTYPARISLKGFYDPGHERMRG